MAQVRIRRNTGVFGKLAGLDVVIDDKKIATLREGEHRLLEDLQDGALLHVEMHGHVRSPTHRISEASTELECGSNWWLAIDWLDFCYLPMLRGRVFYLRSLR